MKMPAFTTVCLSGVKVIMMIMHVPVVELLYQTVIGRLLVLKYMLSGGCGCMLSCLVMPGIKFCPPMLIELG
jgi:hypothetical protein